MTNPNVAIDAFVPFYTHLVPRSVVADGLREVMVAVVDPEHLDEVSHQVWSALSANVEAHAFRMLIGEFHSFRADHGLPRTVDGDRALRRFRRHLDEPGTCSRIIGRYPVLERRLETVLRNALDAYTDLFVAYAEDRPALRAAGLIGATSADDELVTGIFLTGADPHNDNRQVIGVRLGDDTRVVFKPRTLTTDRFVRDLYAAADPHLSFSLRECLPLSLTVGSHGWQQFIPAQAMDTPEQPARYFYRFGSICAILGAIGASDLHDENLLARGEHPCLIDTETILRPDSGVDNDTLAHTLINQMKLSVVSTMLVPMVHPGSPVDFFMAGVGVAGDQSSKLTSTVVRDNGTDNISVRREPIVYRHRGNVPRLGESPVSATDYFADLLAGYFDALAFVRGDGITTILDAYPDMRIRYVVRATLVYGRFIDASTHPDYLARAEEAVRLLGLLRDFSDGLSAEAARRIGAEERACLSTGNVPYFSSRADSSELATSRVRIPGVFRTSALDHARRGVALNSARTDRYHHFLLEECFGELFDDENPAGLSAVGVFAPTLSNGTRPGTWWPKIARTIADIGVTFETADGAQVGWLCGIGPGRRAMTITPGNCISFHDVGGIVSFLTRAAEQGGVPAGVGLDADRGLDALAAEYAEVLMETPESVFSGASSMLLTRPAAVDPDWLERVLVGVDERSAAQLLETDLANGPAGLLMVLLSRLEAGNGGVPCGESWLGRLRDPVLGHIGAARTVAWFDVAHGELGLRWAAARMGRVLGDDALAKEAADWLIGRWESGEESQSTGWCNGAAGMLLTSAEILCSAGRREWLTDGRLTTLVDKATRLPVDRPVDLSVCHGSSGVVQSLLAAGGILGDEALSTRAHEYQEAVLQRVRANGFHTGAAGRTSLLGYMLGWAGIGDTDLMLHTTGVDGGSAAGHRSVPVALIGSRHG
ncbi:type 2 lanthipeptide synthetase LanM [Embleya hyalina]|uniref:Lanthionine synthetase n=1 Tax=Embleya hyalina TaxID=516124 RepID=A0A401YR33_9ACTN|nr:type 2 lanthipeptide synthetase LanM [Embleya hyalina]GCD97068.1 lanthionine synthetase [Embleya hyalina]